MTVTRVGGYFQLDDTERWLRVFVEITGMPSWSKEGGGYCCNFRRVDLDRDKVYGHYGNRNLFKVASQSHFRK